jgi:hypothetical protein
MINPFTEINWRPDRRERRKFGLSLMLGFPSIAAVLSVAGRIMSQGWRPFPLWLGAIGLLIGLVIWLVPQISHPLYVAWYFLAACIGIVVANTLFCAFYFFVLTPLGAFLRKARPAFFSKGFDKTAPTYWRDVKSTSDLNRYYSQF